MNSSRSRTERTNFPQRLMGCPLCARLNTASGYIRSETPLAVYDVSPLGSTVRGQCGHMFTWRFFVTTPLVLALLSKIGSKNLDTRIAKRLFRRDARILLNTRQKALPKIRTHVLDLIRNRSSDVIQYPESGLTSLEYWLIDGLGLTVRSNSRSKETSTELTRLENTLLQLENSH